MPILGSIASGISGNLGFTGPAYDFIAATSPTSTVATFTSIPATYKHLRIHILARSSYTAYDVAANITFNNDSTGGAYRKRYTLSNGSATLYASSGAAAFSWALPDLPGSYITAGNFASGVCEIFDYASTTKIKTLNAFGGYATGGYGQSSGYWNDLSVINRIDITLPSGNYVSGSHVALYGLRG